MKGRTPLSTPSNCRLQGVPQCSLAYIRRSIRAGRAASRALGRCLAAATKPAAPAMFAGAWADRGRCKPQLIAENALLRQQLLVLRRRVKRPRCSPADRAVLVLIASRVRRWRQAVLIVQPDTLLRWLYWPRSLSFSYHAVLA